MLPLHRLFPIFRRLILATQNRRCVLLVSSFDTRADLSRVIYFTRTIEEEIVLLVMYAKARTDNIAGAKLKEIRRALEN